MDFKKLINELVARKTLQEIADECGFSSRGHVHDLKTGRQLKVSYEIGVKLVAMHKKIMRRKAP
jgi:AraC-like DNA-binding protein